MKSYLLDTNICIMLLRNRSTVVARLAEAGPDNCFISDITVAELLFGAEKSGASAEVARTQAYIEAAQVLPLRPVLAEYARRRWVLQRIGQPIDDFDLLIGATALHHGLIMVTNNTKHFARLPGLRLEDWSQPAA